MPADGSSSAVDDFRPRTIEPRPEHRAHMPAARVVRLSPGYAFSLPLAFTLGLTAFGVLDSARQNPILLWSVLGAGAALFVWDAVLWALALRHGRTLTLEVVLRKQHYVQACAQGSVLLYWGWYWRQAYDVAPSIAAQIVFAYAFDMLLTWSRRDVYALGFTQFPVVFSINLFLWFKPDWFYLQFLMVAVGFAAKELLRWDKEGRHTHIFNPSSFPLALFSLGLILTGMSDITSGREIAITQFYPPHIYLVLFLIALPGQLLFGVTPMTMSAVVTTYLFGLAYRAVTGTYFFYDSYVPIAVFLGMHLLFTDPSTSPGTELGRIMFGALYGLSTIALYALLGTLGVPTFYDKLLQVPILNLSIKAIDRAARSDVLGRFDPAMRGRFLAPSQRHLAYISMWGIVFTLMITTGGLGDRHPGQWLPFWQQACAEQRPRACRHLTEMEARFCDAGSGWACNELAILGSQGNFDPAGAAASLERGCDLGFPAACANAERVAAGSRILQRAPPALDDYPIVLRGTKGPISDRTPSSLYARACSQGWPNACAQR
jgi:hypothetical protein